MIPAAALARPKGHTPDDAEMTSRERIVAASILAREQNPGTRKDLKAAIAGLWGALRPGETPPARRVADAAAWVAEALPEPDGTCRFSCECSPECPEREAVRLAAEHDPAGAAVFLAACEAYEAATACDPAGGDFPCPPCCPRACDSRDWTPVHGLVDALPRAAAAVDMNALAPEYAPDPAKILSAILGLASRRPEIAATWTATREDMPHAGPGEYACELASLLRAEKMNSESIYVAVQSFLKTHDPATSEDVDAITAIVAAADAVAGLEVRTMQAKSGQSAYLQGRTAAFAEGGSAATKALAAAHRPELVANLATSLALPVEAVEKHNGTPPIFVLRLASGESIELGTAEILLRHDRVTAKIMGAVGLVIPYFRRKEWANILQILLDAAEDVYDGAEATEEGRIDAIIRRYIAERRPSKDIAGAIRSGSPFLRDDDLCIRLAGLRDFMAMHRHFVDDRRLPMILRRLGFQNEKMHVTFDGRATTVSAYTGRAADWS